MEQIRSTPLKSIKQNKQEQQHLHEGLGFRVKGLGSRVAVNFHHLLFPSGALSCWALVVHWLLSSIMGADAYAEVEDAGIPTEWAGRWGCG